MKTHTDGHAPRPRPVEIELHDVHPADVTESELLGTALRLAGSFPELSGCRVVLEPARGSAAGVCYHALLDLDFPPGRLEVTLPPDAAASRQNFTTLLCEALERGRRAEAMHHCTHPPDRSPTNH